MNRRLLIGKNSIFPPNSLIAYVASNDDPNDIGILKSWPVSDSIQNAKNLISCIKDTINPMTMKGVSLFILFNTRDFPVEMSEYRDFFTDRPLTVSGLGMNKTTITVTENSTVERLFKTSASSPIVIQDLAIKYTPIEPQPDTGIIELDMGGPVELKNLSICGSFSAGIVSHLGDNEGEGNYSTISNVEILEDVDSKNSSNCLVIDRRSKFGTISNLKVRSTSTAIDIDTLNYPFKVDATILNGGDVIIGGENAIYNLQYTDLIKDQRLIVNTNNSIINIKSIDSNYNITTTNNGLNNTINNIK